MDLLIKNLVINIGEREILRDVDFGASSGARVGIIGRNGVGKTTLLKAILGQIDYLGNINYTGKAVYFSQHIELEMDKTAREVISLRAEVHHKNEFENKIKKIEEQLANPDIYNHAEKLNKLTEEYSHLQIEIAKHASTVPTSKIKSVLSTLNVDESWLDKKVSELSTGQRAIIALARILSSDAEILLLDEPTNHLDFRRIEILKNYLKNFKGIVMMVTHDRYFLNEVANTILKIEKGKFLKYTGNYSTYIKMRQENFLAQQKAFHLENKYIANEKDKIARIGKGKAKVKQGKYREKLLAKREEVERPDLDKSNFSTTLETKKINAVTVLELVNLKVGYDKPLISDINLKVGSNERIIITGSNGVGKSTLLKTIEGRVKKLGGGIDVHSQGKIEYIDQELRDLNHKETLYDEIYDLVKDLAKTREQLSIGGFVDEDDVHKPIALLSMGEKARLNLIKVLIKKPNILLLDEPTNHLDLDACEIIENAFLNFEGAIVAVSHDRYFIDKIADTIVEVDNGKIKIFQKKMKKE